MHGDVLLGIDLGTTFCKAGVIDLAGRELAQARVRTPWQEVPTGAELDPYQFVEIARQAALAALAQVPGVRVLGIGFTSMGETGVLLDEQGRPLAPAIAWHDLRGDAETLEIAERFGAEAFTRRTGLPATRLCTLAKLRWLTKQEPDLRRAWRWLNVAEWVAYAWGAEPAAELSLASRTGFLDLRSQAWWEETLEWLGFAPSLLPPLVAAGTPVGRARPGLLPGAEGAVLTIGGHDHPCAAVGAGVVESDTVLDSNGTAEALVRAVSPQLTDEQILAANRGGVTVGWHAVPDSWSLLGGILGGKALNRFLRLLGCSAADLAALDAQALALPPAEPLPRITGITADEANLLGIGWQTGPAHVWRAAHEALAREARSILAVMEQVAGPVDRIVAIGGWTRSPLVRQVKQSVFGQLDYPPIEEAGTRGAALLAGLAAGIYPRFSELPSVQEGRSR